MSEPDKSLPRRSSSSEIDAFVEQAAATPPRTGGRLIFAMDATASRQATWDRACEIQAEMFTEAARMGGLQIQLCYYRGYRECRCSRWLAQAQQLQKAMGKVGCRGGLTQIERVLDHAVAEARRQRVQALAFVGDCMEEDPDRLAARAGELALLGVPAFIFQEGYEAGAERLFRHLAALTGGAYSRFDLSSPRQLRDLLAAAAVYTVGGQQALDDYGRRQGGLAHKVSRQLGRDRR